jgi:hypothetical protein
MFMFVYFIVINIYLYVGLTHFMFLVLAFVFMFWSSESMISYTTKVVMNNCSHIFIHKCKKVKMKPFQSLSNHHSAQYF